MKKSFIKIFVSFIILFTIFKLNKYSYSFNILFSNLNLFFIYPLFLLISLILISIRWKSIINNSNINYSFVDSFKISSISFGYNVATLSGAGDIFKLLIHQKVSKEELVNSIILERYSGLIITIIITFFVIGINFFKINLNEIIIYLLIIVIIFIVLFKSNFLFKSFPYLNILNYKLSYLTNNTSLFIRSVAVSFFIQCSYYISNYILMKLFGIDLLFKEIIIFIILLSVANFLPFTFSGFGSREVAVIIFSTISDFEISYFIDFTLTLGLINLIYGLIFLIVSKKLILRTNV